MSDFETLARDIARQRKRAETSTYLEYRKDAVANLWPLLADLVAACDERMRETEEMVAELIENTQSIVQPDLAIQIMSLIDIGDQLAQLVSASPATDDMTKKRLAEALTAWTAAAPLVREAVQEATVEPDEGDEGDEGDEEGDEDEDQDGAEDEDDEVEASSEETEAQNG